MRLLIIRHAAAVPHGTPGIADDDRPLTPKGKAKFRVRATAELAARAFKRVEPRVEPALAHGGVDAILAALRRQPRDAMVAIVGHEPVLGALLARLLGAPDDERFPFKKGGAALVDLAEGPSGHAQLVWFLKPRILRRLARA